MALEFTRLSDVTLVEEATDTANVLIEEGGEIKRVPKTEVGGGGKADMVVKINAPFTDDPTTLTADKFSIESGSLEDVKNILASGNVPIVKVKYCCDVHGDGYMLSGSEFLCGVDKYDQSMYFYYINPRGQHRIIMSLDDTAYLSYEFIPWAPVSGGTVF